MGTGILRYKNGDVTWAKVTVVDAKDRGNFIVDIGGKHLTISERHLSNADVRPSAMRPNTPEEDAVEQREQLMLASRLSVVQHYVRTALHTLLAPPPRYTPEQVAAQEAAQAQADAGARRRRRG